MSTQIQTLTAEDLLRMPKDGFRYELVRGELRKMAAPGNKHGKITARLTWRLAQYGEENNLGVVYAAETGFLLSTNPDTVRAPDVAFVDQKRLDEVGEVDGYWPGAPDLVVEVISPSDAYTEVEERALDGLDGGTRLVMIVDPRKRTVTVYRALNRITILTEEATLDGADVVSGWSAPVHELFA
jgi:Uma2 family endonuclease